MKYLQGVLQISILYGFFLVGSWLRDILLIPLPGSIIGLLLLWIALSIKILPLRWIEKGSYFILAYLPLYFIPSMIAVMDYGHVFVGKGFLLIIITIISTLLTMFISGWTSQIMASRSSKRKERLVCKQK
ncbi:CidA/LrgA family protein [Sporosarcina sp. CAU 1771]